MGQNEHLLIVISKTWLKTILLIGVDHKENNFQNISSNLINHVKYDSWKVHARQKEVQRSSEMLKHRRCTFSFSRWNCIHSYSFVFLLHIHNWELGLGHDGLFIEEAQWVVNVHIIIILWRSRWTPHLQVQASKYFKTSIQHKWFSLTELHTHEEHFYKLYFIVVWLFCNNMNYKIN